ncbi:manganese-dependent inorganic pyrophosphatase [Paraliobacillus ryukyuensis]|uniref:Probable manganese-dependent inorganic pyrophosphatase n=1 Tax=Paraliobacillus ryukyuensis TaxID=200904 RepID=A0A366EGZ8_9BACI|nr:manganese-dependent inorganic pyrophosphatase [Paraliobacillus ryukyuensis]RBP01654.1 manganese-dependent inorganic pyrophosphatase [Paraliobacillus ryukyuensis]
MSKTFIFGHKNPDTDTITAALAYAYLKKQLGQEVEAVRLGEVNNETQYALDYFKVEAPRYVSTVADEVDSVILVDHNERQQSVDDIEKVQVKEVIDHHRIANFETNDPLYYRAEPVGCTATILKKIYQENNVAIPKEIAGLMFSAIISDSLLFKSPTCTEEDVQAADALATIAGVDPQTYGLEMLKAGADLSDKTVEELISLDAKEFNMAGTSVEVAQVNTVDINDVLANQTAIEEAIQQTIDKKQLGLFAFVVTDILNNDSVILALGDKQKTVEQAFDVTLTNNQALLKGVVSRKKQIVPNIQGALA